MTKKELAEKILAHATTGNKYDTILERLVKRPKQALELGCKIVTNNANDTRGVIYTLTGILTK